MDRRPPTKPAAGCRGSGSRSETSVNACFAVPTWFEAWWDTVAGRSALARISELPSSQSPPVEGNRLVGFGRSRFPNLSIPVSAIAAQEEGR